MDVIPRLSVVDGNFKSGDIVFIGRICEQKRLDTLLSAFTPLISIGWINKLVIVGGGDLEWLRKEVERCSIDSSRVEVIGFDPNPEKYLCHASCFINPSESEGMPNSVIEACSFGVPVILSDIPVHRYIARSSGMEDFLFPVGDSSLLTQRIIDLFNLSEGEFSQLRRRCAEYGRGFSKENRDQEYIRLYENAVRKNHEGMGR